VNARLVHDVCWATAQHIVEVFAPLLREEERKDAFLEVYERVKAGLEAYCLQDDRMQHRLKPHRN
jgi:hypothetical protein